MHIVVDATGFAAAWCPFIVDSNITKLKSPFDCETAHGV